jgi:hypothetical protein
VPLKEVFKDFEAFEKDPSVANMDDFEKSIYSFIAIS